MKNIRTTKGERDIMRDALGGGSGTECRNYFCTGKGAVDFPVCENLVSLGLMQRRNAPFCGDFIYHVTDQGKGQI